MIPSLSLLFYLLALNRNTNITIITINKRPRVEKRMKMESKTLISIITALLSLYGISYELLC
jgi:hypothetical protein